MLKKRIIPTLLLDNRKLVKTINFKNPKYIGDPLNAIRIFNEKFVDELIIIDIKQNKKISEIDYDFLKDLFSQCFIPITYGGGVSNLKQADKILKIGAEKIALNSSVLENKNIIKEFSNEFGSQSVVVSIDVKKSILNNYEIYNNKFNKIEKKINLNEYIFCLEKLGAGEVIINSIDKEGTMSGMDLNLIKNTHKLIKLPILYSGGVGSVEDIKLAFNYKISGVSAGSFFVFHGPHKAVLITYPRHELEKL